MKKIILSSTIICSVFLLTAFTNNHEVKYSGTYGVSKNDPSKIILTLNEDETFTYQDLSDFDNLVRTSGTWTNNKNHIELYGNNPELKFHSKWKIVDDGMSVKSRMGLTFYTLRKK